MAGIFGRIKERGFVEREGDPIGRYVSGELVVDVMPTEADVLGITNKWYKKAFAKAVYRELPSGNSIKTVTPVYFIATKFEAFRGRGKGDVMASPDLEDIITILVEVSTFEEELKQADRDVQKYIYDQFKKLVSDKNYPHFLSGHLRGDEASQAFLPELRQLIEKIASGRF